MELIGAKLPSINKAEDRELFKQAMKKIGLKTPPSGTVETWEDALKVLPAPQPETYSERATTRVQACDAASGVAETGRTPVVLEKHDMRHACL